MIDERPKTLICNILRNKRAIIGQVILFAGLALGWEVNPAKADRASSLSDSGVSDNYSKIDSLLENRELADNSAKVREYDFEGANQNNSPFKYRVEVYGNSDSLLRLVKKIEPSAFRNGKVIRAGTFKEQRRAEEQVLRLTSQGIWARIVIMNEAPKKAGSR